MLREGRCARRELPLYGCARCFATRRRGSWAIAVGITKKTDRRRRRVRPPLSAVRCALCDHVVVSARFCVSDNCANIQKLVYQHAETDGKTVSFSRRPTIFTFHSVAFVVAAPQWRKLRRLQVATGGQRGIMSYFSHATHRRPTRDP